MNAPRTRVQRRPVHGVLLLDKPLGLSSNDALQKAKWLLRAEKAGHTGTLDPLATGVLPLCFGAATKFSQLHLDADKTYEAVAVPGREDQHRRCRRRGDRRAARAGASRRAAGRGLQHRFTGPIAPGAADAQRAEEGRQGAVRIRPRRRGGRARARATSRSTRSTLAAGHEDAAPRCASTARVSKGTYIRTLGEDIGEALGCGAHLSFAAPHGHRAASASPQCITLEALEAMDEDERVACAAARRGAAGRAHARHARRGRCRPLPVRPAPARRLARRASTWPSSAPNPPALLGTAHVKAGELIPGRLLSPIEIQQILGSNEPAIP